MSETTGETVTIKSRVSITAKKEWIDKTVVSLKGKILQKCEKSWKKKGRKIMKYTLFIMLDISCETEKIECLYSRVVFKLLGNWVGLPAFPELNVLN